MQRIGNDKDAYDKIHTYRGAAYAHPEPVYHTYYKPAHLSWCAIHEQWMCNALMLVFVISIFVITYLLIMIYETQILCKLRKCVQEMTNNKPEKKHHHTNV